MVPRLHLTGPGLVITQCEVLLHKRSVLAAYNHQRLRLVLRKTSSSRQRCVYVCALRTHGSRTQTPSGRWVSQVLQNTGSGAEPLLASGTAKLPVTGSVVKR